MSGGQASPAAGPPAGASSEGQPPGRVTDAEALALLEGGDLLAAGARADAVRRRLHPGGEVTFIVDRNINYTDYCLSGCRFCAFYKKPGSGRGTSSPRRTSTARSRRRSSLAARPS